MGTGDDGSGNSTSAASMTIRTTAGLLITATTILVVTWPGCPAHGQGVSREVEEALRETRFDRPPSPVEKQELVDRLRRHGIETVTDLRPYLKRSEEVRGNALIAIGHVGNVDPGTLKAIEDLARSAARSPAPSVATAVRIVLNNLPRREAADFAISIAPQASMPPLHELMSWVSSQDRAWIAASPRAASLAKNCLLSMNALFQTGTYSGKWPMTFSLSVERPPFSERAHSETVTRTFLTAVRNAARVTDLRNIAFISSFMAVARGAKTAPLLVEEGLVEIVTTAPAPLVKLILWRMSADGLAHTESGQRVVAAVLRRFPDLASFIDRLTNALSAGSGNDVKDEIDRALREL
jgi:hypothetical protein